MLAETVDQDDDEDDDDIRDRGVWTRAGSAWRFIPAQIVWVRCGAVGVSETCRETRLN